MHSVPSPAAVWKQEWPWAVPLSERGSRESREPSGNRASNSLGAPRLFWNFLSPCACVFGGSGVWSSVWAGWERCCWDVLFPWLGGCVCLAPILHQLGILESISCLSPSERRGIWASTMGCSAWKDVGKLMIARRNVSKSQGNLVKFGQLSHGWYYSWNWVLFWYVKMKLFSPCCQHEGLSSVSSAVESRLIYWIILLW